MKLSEFISDTLNDIREGLKEANKGGNDFYMNTNYKVEFDVAVDIENASSVKGKGGASIQVVKADLEGKLAGKQTNTSRIHFSVGVKRSVG